LQQFAHSYTDENAPIEEKMNVPVGAGGMRKKAKYHYSTLLQLTWNTGDCEQK